MFNVLYIGTGYTQIIIRGKLTINDSEAINLSLIDQFDSP